MALDRKVDDISFMANFVFTCPATKLKHQHQLDDDPYLSDTEYEVIICPSCNKLHFLNRRTGKLFRQGEEKQRQAAEKRAVRNSNLISESI